MRDNLMTESEPAQALREIRSRYPDFDMVHFVRMLKVDVPVVIKAYLEGDLEALREHSAPDMMERFAGIIKAQKAEVPFFHPECHLLKWNFYERINNFNSLPIFGDLDCVFCKFGHYVHLVHLICNVFSCNILIPASVPASDVALKLKLRSRQIPIRYMLQCSDLLQTYRL